MRSNRVLALGATAAVIAVVAAVGAWYLLIRNDAPPPVSLAGAAAALAPPAPSVSAAGTPTTTAASATATQTAAADSAAPASLVGDWRISASGDSFVGYRVVEELANFGANTAVGRTSDVTGTLSFDGSAITEVQIEANLTTLRSDDSRRDNTLRRQSLESGSFPTATFALTQPITLDHEPAEDETVEATAQGQLTLHGVTRDVTIPIQGQISGGRVIVVGSLEIAFVDFEIEPPRARLVLSIEDHATLELQLVFER